MKFHFGILFFVLGILLLVGSPYAKAKSPFYPTLPPHTPESVMEMVYEATQYVTKTGDVGEFNKKNGKFTQGAVLDYHFVMFLNCSTGEFYAHPFLEGMKCKKGFAKKFKDANGKLYVVKLCLKAKRKPEGNWTMSNQTYPNSIEASPMPLFTVGIPQTPYAILAIGRELDKSEEELNSLVKDYQDQHYPHVWPDKMAKIKNPCENIEKP